MGEKDEFVISLHLSVWMGNNSSARAHGKGLDEPPLVVIQFE